MLEQGGYPYELICLDEGIDVPRDLDTVAGLVFMGGPGNVGEPTAWMLQELELIRAAADKGVPMLGICLGAQLISKALGGEVMPARTLEVGWHEVEWFVDAPPARHWFADLPPRFEVFQWHAHTYSLPAGAVALARSACAGQQAFSIGNILALQFHIEITAESICSIVERYPGDLENVSACVQSRAAITEELGARTRELYRVADVVFGRWLDMVYKDN
jgi:GMP synthase-like glutamine amidotransferase